MVNLIIVRHGCSISNKEKRFTGHLDIPLSDEGKMQAELVSNYIYDNFKVDAIYSSDLSRARDTVKPLADKLGLEIIETEKLRETNAGIWQGMLLEDIRVKYPEDFLKFKYSPGLFKFNGGESYEEVMARARSIITEIAQNDNNKTVVIATHGGFIRALFVTLNNIPLKNVQDIPLVHNASTTVLGFSDNNFKFITVGYDDYLKMNSLDTIIV